MGKWDPIFGDFCLVTRNGPPAYVVCMFSAILVLGGVFVGLFLLLALIVSLSARPTAPRGGSAAGRAPSWVADAGRPHPDAWSPLSQPGTNELPAVR